MSWTRKQKLVRTNKSYEKRVKNSLDYMPNGTGAASNKFSNLLPEVYSGHPLRTERYDQYDQMDRDSEINTALSIIANFCTQDDPNTDLKFKVNYVENIADSEMEIIEKLLRQWSKVNKFKTRLWRMFRSTLKYGDQFFLRDPETLEWYYIAQDKVEKALVNEAEGKEIEAYIIRDLDINKTVKTATPYDTYGNDLPGQSSTTLQNQIGYQNRYGNTTQYGHYSDGVQNMTPVAAEHIIHLTVGEGLDAGWPFGTSILESVFKVFRQKELLEDAILIYRIIRAPERRVFYVDTGQIPPHKAGPYLERFKTEIQQKRMPSVDKGTATLATNTVDVLSPIDDYYFAVGEGGRSSRVEILPGGAQLNSINDLVFWNNKLIRGLGVPAGYLPYGPEDGGMNYNDGRLGTTYQQEYSFAQYCMRLQNLLAEVFDKEFKLFLKQRGYNIDSASFNIDFITPQHFSEYAKIEKDAAAINNFQSMVNLPFISPRWAMEQFLGLSKSEIMENEKYMMEENPEELENDSETQEGGFDTIGIRSSAGSDFGGMSDFGSDLDMDDDTGDTGGLDFDIGGDTGEAPATGGGGDLDLPT